MVCECVRSAIDGADWGKVAVGLHVTASLGVAQWLGDWDRTLERADGALYVAKRSGRNQVRIVSTEQAPPGAVPLPRRRSLTHPKACPGIRRNNARRRAHRRW